MMSTTLAQLKVGSERITEEGQVARLAAIRATLPHQLANGVTQEAALRFGLPMTGQEIHERVRRTLRSRWWLTPQAWVGVAIFSFLAAMFLGYLFPWAAASMAACQNKCEDSIAGLVTSLALGVGALLCAGGIFAGTLRVMARTSVWVSIASYVRPIPAAALLKYAEAKQAGLFQAFWVVEPSYEDIATLKAQRDPWIVGSVVDSHPINAMQDDRCVYVVLAYWD